ncbi:hypothetical protein MACJ_003014 [Theileria orientalis]|uniref:E3 ubiquitin-protein ligase n=1 Tax=Theileria orientalis TaxID=68886 RepID=A0A976QVU8_THEOR|nr:hypothetical protein MACJ_003014 [Theileria orientalis]
MDNFSIKPSDTQSLENINFDNSSSKDAIFNQLYKYLYGFCDKNHIIALINDYNSKGYSGFCTNKWLEETVAIKCYDCEYDGTCAICLDCFFDSDHNGHEYRLTKTSGGCCDCGDPSSWDVKGSCSVHTNGTIFDEKLTLDFFTNSFLIRLERLITHVINNVSYYLHNINAVNGEILQILVLFLNDVANVTSAYRYSLSLCLSRNVLKDWMLRHQILPNDLQKSFNSFYLTMITSMSFKKRFSSLFAELYVDIVQPLKEIQDDWHLSNLSVQLFTYSNIALELVKNQFMDTCIDPIVDKAPIDKRLNTLQFARFDRKKFNLYIRIISDLTYLMNHTVVCHLLLSDERLQKTVFRLFFVHNYMNLIERYTKTHVQFENTGYSIAFTVEHSLHSAFKPLSDYIKSLGDTNISIVLNFYKNLNDFIKDNAINVSFNTHKLARSFHIPLVRLFSSVVDFNLVRRYIKYHLNNIAMTDERIAKYLNNSFVELKSNDNFTYDLFAIFDNDVLLYVLRSTINVLKFAMEINHNLWVYNGESLRDQRTTYYELFFDSFDIASIQMSVVLLGMNNINSDFDVLSYIFDICFDLEHYGSSPFKSAVETYRNTDIAKNKVDETSIQEINNLVDKLMYDVEGGLPISHQDTRMQRNTQYGEDNGSFVDINRISHREQFDIKFYDIQSGMSDPGSFEFKINFFYIILNTLVNDIKHLEILSISRKTTKEWFVKRGYPLLLMDIVNSLASGNVEFGQIVKETKKHWKHHPMFIETIERVAIFNYSKVSDKTYIRLKPEAYKMIDILWNTHHPSTHVLSVDLINQDISLLGPVDADCMSPEYRETQAMILNSISCNMLLNYILLVFLNFYEMQFKMDKSGFESLPDLFKTDSISSPQSNYMKFELASNMVLCSNYKFKSSSHILLYSFKMLNLLYSKLAPPSEETGVILVSCLTSMLKSMDDDLYKKCTTYTLSMLNSVYNFKNTVDKLSIDSDKKDVKMIQKKYLNRIFKQNSLFKIDTEYIEKIDNGETEESITCILCKQKMESETPMSCMCFISTNNVLRRCSSSNGFYTDSLSPEQFIVNRDIGSNTTSSLQTHNRNDGSLSTSILTFGKSFNDTYGDVIRRTYYGVYTMSSMPLKSSVISSCGHIAHTSCINEHRNVQGDIASFSIYGIHRSSTEFLCPMCKTLCNFTLNMVPDSKMKKYRVNENKSVLLNEPVDEEYKNYNFDDVSVDVVSVMSVDDMNEESDACDSLSNDSTPQLDTRQNMNICPKYKRNTFINLEDNANYNIYDLCESSWRYPYSNLWIPCPVYGKNEWHSQYVYALNLLSSSNSINYYLNTDNNNRVDRLSLSFDTPMKNIDCSYCYNFDFDLFNINMYKCEAFKHKENYLISPIRVFDRQSSIKMESVYRYFMENWDVIMNSNAYNLINLRGTELDYKEMFTRSILTQYSRSLFSDKRAYFGIRNWRHVNATVEMDPKFWLLYNELLSTSSVRRNMLNVPNAFYSQLLRNFYFTGMTSDTTLVDFDLLNISQHNVTLDKTYHDCDDTRIVLPDLSIYNDKMLEKQTNMIRTFVESLSESNLSVLYDNFCNNDTKNINDSYYEESTTADDFFDRIKNSNYDSTNIKSILPLKNFLFSKDKHSVYKVFGNDMLLSPWSFDYIREYLKLFLSERNYSRSELTDFLYFFMVVASLQVMDRFIVDLMRVNYSRFIYSHSDGDEKILKTRIKIEFLTAYAHRFFSDLLANAEFPCDFISRIAFSDFEQNSNEFMSYNMMLSQIDQTGNLLQYRHYKSATESHYTLNTMLSEIIEYTGILKSVHDNHIEALTEPIPYDQIVHDRGSTYISDDLLDTHLFNQVTRILKAREIHNNLNNKYDFESLAYSLEDLFYDSISHKRQRLDHAKKEPNEESPSSILKNASNDTPSQSKAANCKYMYKGVDLAMRLNNILYRNHSNTIFFETIKHIIPQSLHILDFINEHFRQDILNVDLDGSTTFLSMIENLFNFIIRYFIKMGYINYEPFKREIYRFFGRDGYEIEQFTTMSTFKLNEYDEFTCAVVHVMFEKYKSQMFESLNLFLDIAFWSINSIFKYDDEVSSKVLYGHLNSDDTRFNLLIEALGIGATSNKIKPSEIVSKMFSETYKLQMDLNRKCNMEVTPPIVSKYSLIDIERNLTELQWDMIKITAMRCCPCCGLKPANPLICLLCGSLVCSNNECCHKVQSSKETRFMLQVEKKLEQVKKREFMSIYEEEMVAHGNVCGGGQCIYFSPYHCCLVLVEERRRSTMPSIYSDQYGNSDLHGKVYGDVKLARVRLENIVNTFCSGRLSNEIVSHRKQLINLLV